MAERIRVGIVIFDDVEVLDFAGPFEVFSRTRTEPGPASRRSEASAPFEVFTVARSREPVSAVGGLRVTPHYAFADAPSIDLLVVPGGFGTRALLEDQATLDFLRLRAASARLVSSVCTGALLLARIGALDGRRATTHHGALDLLAEVGGGRVEVARGSRYVDDVAITSAGVAAGIDMAFYLVEKFCGRVVADETARYIEHPRRGADGRILDGGGAA